MHKAWKIQNSLSLAFDLDRSLNMDFAVGDLVEAVDELGIWAKGKIAEKRDNSVLVTFPPWN